MRKPLFNPGDRVLRIEDDRGCVKKGEIYTVEMCTTSTLLLVNVGSSYEPSFFTLVSKKEENVSHEDILIQFIN